jgi:hypothetical protein
MDYGRFSTVPMTGRGGIAAWLSVAADTGAGFRRRR